MVEITTNEEFQSEVIDSSANNLVLVDFWASWCGPCLMLKPTLEKLESESGYKLVAINVDDAHELSQKFGIRSIPTCKIYKGGSEIDNFVGAMSESALKSKIDKLNETK